MIELISFLRAFFSFKSHLISFVRSSHEAGVNRELEFHCSEVQEGICGQGWSDAWLAMSAIDVLKWLGWCNGHGDGILVAQ